MSTIYGPNDSVIEIPFPSEKYQQFLDRHGINPKQEMTYKTRKVLFLSVVRSFLLGHISLDEMSEIAGHLWSTLKDNEKTTTDLGDALYKCSELNFYARKISKENPGNFDWFMSTVMTYFEKNKHLIDA